MKQRKDGAFAANFESYWTLAEMYAWLDELAQTYPNIVTVIEAGESESGRHKIKGVKIHHAGPARDAMVLEGTVHAREWISGATAIWIINHLLTSTDSEVQSLASSYDWYIFPVGNPDGYEYTWTTNRNWRKNRKQNNALCWGVDLNRNFDIKHNEQGASTNPCSDTYAGPRGFSEKETLGFSNFLKTIPTRIYGYLSFHAYGQM